MNKHLTEISYSRMEIKKYKMKGNIDLSIIIVNYNGKHFLESCLNSLSSEIEGLNVEVFFVDNNSTDGSSSFIEKRYPWIKLIPNKINMGFAKANNQAIELSIGKYIFLLNPDTEIIPGAIYKMIDVMNKNSNAGAIACKLLNSDMTLQFSIGNFPNLFSLFLESLFLHRVFSSFVSAELVFDKRRYENFHEIEWAFGAALMVRKSVIDQVGTLDDEYFFGSEEKDLCYRIKVANWKILYEPSAKIIHHGRGWRDDYTIDENLLKGKIRFEKKHFSKVKSTTCQLIRLLNLNLRFVRCLIVNTSLKNKKVIWSNCAKYWKLVTYCYNEIFNNN